MQSTPDTDKAHVAALPGYVRLELPCGGAAQRRACRRFVELCSEEGARRALIVASPEEGSAAHGELRAASRCLPSGLKLAVVARGDAGGLAKWMAAPRGVTRAFRSEHHAAAWLMR